LPTLYRWYPSLYTYASNETLSYLENQRWRHYEDGFLTVLNVPNGCLGLDGKLISCIADGLRITKLWSHGIKIIKSFSSSTVFTKYFLLGHRLQTDDNSYAELGANGDIMINFRNRWNYVPSGLSRLKESVMIHLADDGSLTIKNIYGNKTYKTLVEAQKVLNGPYTLSLQNNKIIYSDNQKNIVKQFP
jgi:hypothetical protein